AKSVLAQNFNLYPNPATNMVHITNTENMLVNKIEVYDTTGKLITTESYNNETEIQLNVEHLASGTYMLHLQTNEGTAVRKLVNCEQQADHVGGGRHSVICLERDTFREALVGARRWEAQGTDALGDIVQRQCQLVVLGFEHGGQGVEPRPLHVPVEVVGLKVQ